MSRLGSTFLPELQFLFLLRRLHTVLALSTLRDRCLALRRPAGKRPEYRSLRQPQECRVCRASLMLSSTNRCFVLRLDASSTQLEAGSYLTATEVGLAVRLLW